MGKRMAALLVAVAVTLGLACGTGCESMLEREYIVTSSHAEVTTASQDTSSVRLGSIEEVMELLSEAVRAGTTELSVQLAYHGEDLEEELKDAIASYKNDPICAYAVQLIPYRITKILTYYEIRFDISYRRTAAQIAAIREVSSPEAFEKELHTMLSVFAQSRAFLIDRYDSETYNFDETFYGIYENTPAVAYGVTGASYTLSPESGDARVMEVTIDYAESPATLLTKSLSASSLAKVIASTAEATGDALYVELHDALCRFARYDEETANADMSQTKVVYTDPYTAYGALAQSRAVSAGYAMAYKQLCDEAGIPCKIVHGRLGSDDHVWNLVQLSDENWYHVDVSLDDEEKQTGYRFFGLSDDEMSLTHQWDASKYPACDGENGRDMLPEDEELRSHSRYVDIVPTQRPGDGDGENTDVDVEIVDLPPDVKPTTEPSAGNAGTQTSGTDAVTVPEGPGNAEPDPTENSTPSFPEPSQTTPTYPEVTLPGLPVETPTGEPDTTDPTYGSGEFETAS
ncbi:MAG: transglutaminase domain-containing protein [Clostridiaceae bacterium]|nr:transglutaminase domain-containing protein [Clostridiaceae bacterium]